MYRGADYVAQLHVQVHFYGCRMGKYIIMHSNIDYVGVNDMEGPPILLVDEIMVKHIVI